MFKLMIAILALIAPAAVFAQQADNASIAQRPTAADASYVLGANDEIEMVVFGQPNMTLKTRIKADGTIIAPYVGAIKAAGQTTAQLSKTLGDVYQTGGYLSNPSINVEVTGYGSKSVTVLGAVPNAGLYPLDRPYSIAAMVARAGGSRPDGANAVILTPANGAPTRISLADLQGGAGRPVQAGDTLFVPVAEKIYVYGEVNKGGAFDYQPGLTFRQALALAGGPTLAGSTKRIEIRRAGKPIKLVLDDPAQPEDVLVIKEKLF